MCPASAADKLRIDLAERWTGTQPTGVNHP
jgi:hypothetical protein